MVEKVEKDTRAFYATKTFWGAIAILLDIILVSYSVDIPMFKELAYAWTGLSVADRFRNK